MRIGLIIIMLLFGVSCSSQDTPQNVESTPPPIEVSRLVKAKDKVFLEVDGVPFPVYGAQIRLDALINCDKLGWEQIERYFARGKELGVNCLQVPIWWNAIEPRENDFDFSVIQKVLEYAHRYDIRLELLWFSTNMIGDSFSYLVPQYILKEPSRRLLRNDEGNFWGYYGYLYALILNDRYVLDREKNAVTRLLSYVRQWDLENGEKHPVIAVQVHNEPDGLVRWRMDQKAYKYRSGEALSKNAAWKMTLDALNEVGLAVKNSPYKVATRTNLISGNGTAPYPQAPEARPGDVLALEGIDLVSFDPYMNTVNQVAAEVAAYAALPGNYPLIAENKGVYPNTTSLMLATSALGGGYNIYDLATSRYFIANTNDPEGIDHGVLTADLEDKPHTPSVRKLLKGFTAAGPEIAVTPTDNFAVFNVATDFPETAKEQKIRTTGAEISFTTRAGAQGFALDRSSYLLVYMTAPAILVLSNASVEKVAAGIYSPEGKFTEDAAHAVQAGQTLNLEGGVLYKINYTSQGPLSSTTRKYIGTRF